MGKKNEKVSFPTKTYCQSYDIGVKVTTFKCPLCKYFKVSIFRRLGTIIQTDNNLLLSNGRYRRARKLLKFRE